MFKFELINGGRYHAQYKVFNISEMDDLAILDACNPNNCGGRVTRDSEGNGWARVFLVNLL